MATQSRLGSASSCFDVVLLWSCFGKSIARRPAQVSFVKSRPARTDFCFEFVSIYLAFAAALLFWVAVFCAHRSGVLFPPKIVELVRGTLMIPNVSYAGVYGRLYERRAKAPDLS